jgi:hypothetical protein
MTFKEFLVESKSNEHDQNLHTIAKKLHSDQKEAKSIGDYESQEESVISAGKKLKKIDSSKLSPKHKILHAAIKNFHKTVNSSESTPKEFNAAHNNFKTALKNI